MVKVRSLDSVPFLRYSWFCNVLRICNVRAIPTYRVYRLYDSPDGHIHSFYFLPNSTNMLDLECAYTSYSTEWSHHVASLATSRVHGTSSSTDIFTPKSSIDCSRTRLRFLHNRLFTVIIIVVCTTFTISLLTLNDRISNNCQAGSEATDLVAWGKI